MPSGLHLGFAAWFALDSQQYRHRFRKFSTHWNEQKKSLLQVEQIINFYRLRTTNFRQDFLQLILWWDEWEGLGSYRGTMGMFGNDSKKYMFMKMWPVLWEMMGIVNRNFTIFYNWKFWYDDGCKNIERKFLTNLSEFSTVTDLCQYKSDIWEILFISSVSVKFPWSSKFIRVMKLFWWNINTIKLNNQKLIESVLTPRSGMAIR